MFPQGIWSLDSIIKLSDFGSLFTANSNTYVLKIILEENKNKVADFLQKFSILKLGLNGKLDCGCDTKQKKRI